MAIHTYHQCAYSCQDKNLCSMVSDHLATWISASNGLAMVEVFISLPLLYSDYIRHHISSCYCYMIGPTCGIRARFILCLANWLSMKLILFSNFICMIFLYVYIIFVCLYILYVKSSFVLLILGKIKSLFFMINH